MSDSPSMPMPLSLDDLLNTPDREFLLLAGKDGSGKSSAVVSMAAFVAMTNPDATFWIIDTENKLGAVLKTWGPDAPRNVQYFRCSSINDVTEALDAILAAVKPGDWLAAESMARAWELAQDMGYKAIVGMEKAAWMDRRKADKKAGQKPQPVTPKPDDLWSIIKGAHDGAFLELLAQHETLNVMLTTTVKRPPKEDSNRKESESRASARAEFGLDVGIGGAPNLPYYAQTFAQLDMRGGTLFCRILRDNLTKRDVSTTEFVVPGRKDFAMAFMAECRA